MPSACEDPRGRVRDLVEAVEPFDGREAADRRWALDWVDSGAPLFRTAKPATPPRHLVVYTALLDERAGTVLLVDHAKARTWLPPGGHVDDGEDPQAAAVRERDEELGSTLTLHPRLGPAPFFLTVAETRPPHPHTDVSLWYVFDADQTQPLVPDLTEFARIRWFPLADPHPKADGFEPGLSRFLAKLSSALARPRSSTTFGSPPTDPAF